jgi:nucleosome binding factor SPN SPT16 subunit
MSTHDVTTLVQELLIKKDEAELDKIKKAAGFSCYLQNKIIEQVEKIIDQASKEKQDKIS